MPGQRVRWKMPSGSPTRTWCSEEFGLSAMDAYQLLTQVSESPVANVCDPNYMFVCKVQKQWLPSRDVMSGTHARLEDVGAAYLAERR